MRGPRAPGLASTGSGVLAPSRNCSCGSGNSRLYRTSRSSCGGRVLVRPPRKRRIATHRQRVSTSTSFHVPPFIEPRGAALAGDGPRWRPHRFGTPAVKSGASLNRNLIVQVLFEHLDMKFLVAVPAQHDQVFNALIAAALISSVVDVECPRMVRVQLALIPRKA
jgi:hypothetical protein